MAHSVPDKFDDGRFEIKKKIGEGCFAKVYSARDVQTDAVVALKLEDRHAKSPVLERGAEVLRQMQGVQGFASMYKFGSEGQYNFLAMELLGKSLEDRVQMCKGRLPSEAVARIAEQMLACLEHLHAKGIIHRDVKAENYVCGLGEKAHHIYLIDFGLSKRYWDEKHAALRAQLSLTGTARYASINAQRGAEQSRRDDLESLGYVLAYMLRGYLPWSGSEAKTREEKHRRIREKKQNTTPGELFNGYPEAFQMYLGYCRNLNFKDKPDYAMLHRLFKTIGAGTAEDLPWCKGKGQGWELPPRQAPDQPDEIRKGEEVKSRQFRAVLQRSWRRLAWCPCACEVLQRLKRPS